MKLALFVCLISVVGYYIFQESVHRAIRGEIVSKVNQALPEGVSATVQQAEFIEGVGIQIRGLSIETSVNGTVVPSPLIGVDVAMIQAPVSTLGLVTETLAPTAVKIKRARIQLERFADGRWNFENLLGCFGNQESLGCQVIPVDLIDCQVTVTDRTQNPVRTVEFNQINLKIRPTQDDTRSLIRLEGSLAGVAVKKIGFDAFIDPSSQDWIVNLNATDARLSSDLFRMLPDSLRATTDTTEMLSGVFNLSGNVRGNMRGEMPDINLQGSLRGFALKHPEVPIVLSRTNVDFEVTDHSVFIKEASGLMNDSEFQLQYQQEGLLEKHNWQLAGSIANFEFERKMLNWCPPAFEKFCDDFSPQGISDLQFGLRHDGQKLHKQIYVDLKDMSFSFVQLPFRVEHCAGQLDWVDDLCTFKLSADERGQKIKFNGTVNNPGKRSTFRIDLALDGSLPIDEKLLDAIKPMPNLEKTVLAFRPSGRISGSGNITKSLPEGTPKRSFDIRLHDCTVRHEAFEYPIQNVNGDVLMRESQTTFEEITGKSGIASIECNGSWSLTQGLDLRFLCSQVPLNEQLRQAIPPKIRDIWNGFRPQGVVDLLRVDLKNPTNKALVVSVSADLASGNRTPGRGTGNVSIHPKWFPYTIRNLVGQVEVDSGNIKLTNMKGQHDRTYMIWNGSGSYSDTSWALNLEKLQVGSLVVNEELLAALPKSLAPALRQLEFQGLLMVNGGIQLSGHLQQTTPLKQVDQASFESFYADQNVRKADRVYTSSEDWETELAWNLGFNLVQAKMMIGLPVENVFGMVHLAGRYVGDKAVCRGELALDSLTLYDAQITQVTGPIWIDDEFVLAGTMVGRNGSERPPAPITGQLFGGTLRMDANKATDNLGKFFIQASLAQGELADVVSEFAPQLEQVKGKAFAAVRFSGDNTGLRSCRGNGTMQVRKAEIYELPVILSMLKILHDKDLNRNAFDASNIDFTIIGDRFDLNRIELIGDAISLIGNGQANLDREIDLNFYTVMGRGRFYIPVLSELYRAGSKQVLWLNVNGTLDKPQTNRRILPQLNDSIQQLFEPTTPRSRPPVMPADYGLPPNDNLTSGGSFN